MEGVAVLSPVLGSRVEQVWQVSDRAAAHTEAFGQVWPLSSLPLRSVNHSLQGCELEENKDGYEHGRRWGVLTVGVDAHLVNTVVLVLFIYPQSSRVHL